MLSEAEAQRPVCGGQARSPVAAVHWRPRRRRTLRVLVNRDDFIGNFAASRAGQSGASARADSSRRPSRPTLDTSSTAFRHAESTVPGRVRHEYNHAWLTSTVRKRACCTGYRRGLLRMMAGNIYRAKLPGRSGPVCSRAVHARAGQHAGHRQEQTVRLLSIGDVDSQGVDSWLDKEAPARCWPSIVTRPSLNWRGVSSGLSGSYVVRPRFCSRNFHRQGWGDWRWSTIKLWPGTRGSGKGAIALKRGGEMPRDPRQLVLLQVARSCRANGIVPAAGERLKGLSGPR